MSEPQKDSLIDFAYYFVQNDPKVLVDGNVDWQRLHCLLYLTCLHHMETTGKLLFDDPILKGPNGPWIPALGPAVHFSRNGRRVDCPETHIMKVEL